MRALAHERRRFGYRRLHVLLRREGHVVNHKRLFRLYREEKLAVRRRGGRKRAMGLRAPMVLPTGPNQRWSLDFVSDQLADGRRFRILVVLDDCTRECLALVADTSISGRRVARELDRLVAERGRPVTIVSDNVLHGEGGWRGIQQVSRREFAPASSPSSIGHQAAPTVTEELSAIANTGSSGRAVALTVLNTRCRSRQETRALSTGSRAAPSRHC
jgi:putative transposase